MDYSKLSDTEIAQKVWFWWNNNIPHDNTIFCISDGKMLYQKNRVWTAFDPCNNPADAWTIIVEHKINIEWHEWKNSEWMPYVLNNATTKSCYGTNPLRAAMIVFLMMQESANVQDNTEG
ncbi:MULTISPECIES: phage protein NinX family protein [Citrobacter]|uniref:phage protein NinX family protein n=1 Tax=Citrobacter TaxID=544 RepID=UPI001A24D088|nr:MULTISPECIES: phage protein NinX family protein [Citrobacter]MCQ6309748.1 DUF2591 family protein [Citrobacter portucalensis]MDM2794880.1 DUF2591 family protein [Citrobacter sp. Cpo114]